MLIIPPTISAGVNFSASAWLPEYVGTEWLMRLYLRGPSEISVDATRDSSRHIWLVPAATTRTWAAGNYSYSVRALSGPDVMQVQIGTTRVLADIATPGSSYDPRSENRIALDAINAVLAKRATLDQDRYRINNRELSRTPIGDLLRLRAFYAEAVARENARGKGANPFGQQVKIVMRGGG